MQGSFGSSVSGKANRLISWITCSMGWSTSSAKASSSISSMCAELPVLFLMNSVVDFAAFASAYHSELLAFSSSSLQIWKISLGLKQNLHCTLGPLVGFPL